MGICLLWQPATVLTVCYHCMCYLVVNKFSSSSSSSICVENMHILKWQLNRPLSSHVSLSGGISGIDLHTVRSAILALARLVLAFSLG